MPRDVFPRSNLAPEAVEWGRGVERESRQTYYDLLDLNGAGKSDNRLQAGQMGVVGRQIQDLRARTTQVTQINRISTLVELPESYGLATVRFTRNVILPPTFDGSNRKSLIFLSGIAYNSNPGNTMGTVYVRLNDITSKPMAAPAMTSTPEGYVETVSISTTLDWGNTFNLEFLIIAANNTDSPRTAQMGIESVYIVSVYGDEVGS